MDTGSDRDPEARASERIYRALMRAYPEEVRRRYEEEMVRYFEDLCREERMSRGRIGIALLWARTLPELFFTALKERVALFRRNAYLPLGPGTVARWGALCALVGGSLGVAYHLINYSLLGALNIVTGDFFGNDPFMRFFTLSLFLCALSLSSLGLFGLYGAVVARTGRPGFVAGAGAVFSTAAAALWLATSGYAAISQLAYGAALFAPFEWVWNTGTFVIPTAILFWFLGLLLLGIAAAREGRLPGHLRVLPLALFALILPSYLLGSHFETVGNPVTGVIVMGLAQSLPFVGVALLGWVLIRGYDAAEPLAVPSGSAESTGAGGMARSVRRRGFVFAALLLVLLVCAWAYSARDDLYKTYQGMQPGADQGPAFAASEKLELTKTAGGARVTLTSVYAEEQYVSIGYEVEDLQEGRRAGEHPAELHPLLGSGNPTRREKEYREEHGLGADIVSLTDETGTDFRMVDNYGAVSAGPDNMARGPLVNMVAFEPKEKLEPSQKHRFRLKVPLVESPVVPMEEKQPPPELFEGGPFVFEFEVPVHPVQVVEVGQKETAEGVTLTLERVISSPGRPQAEICYEPPDEEHSWTLYGGEGTLEGGWSTSGWTGTGSMKAVPPAKCQKLMLEEPVEGRSSLEVTVISGMPRCPSGDAEAAEACYAEQKEKSIRGPWRFDFEAPGP